MTIFGWPAKPNVIDPLFYFDTSALARLIVHESETSALRHWIVAEQPAAIASDLVRTELLRTVRLVAPDRMVETRRVLESVTLLRATPMIVDRAGRMDPSGLRSLDAIQLATALELGEELQAVITYDHRFAEAAEANGIPTLGPT